MINDYILGQLADAGRRDLHASARNAHIVQELGATTSRSGNRDFIRKLVAGVSLALAVATTTAAATSPGHVRIAPAHAPSATMTPYFIHNVSLVPAGPIHG